jgi:hypothetical protein
MVTGVYDSMTMCREPLDRFGRCIDNGDMTTTTCRKCQGTGFLAQFDYCDSGKCWRCGGTSQEVPDRRSPEVLLTAEEREARAEAYAAEALAARKARRAARRAGL